jgi:hypothetical protein
LKRLSTKPKPWTLAACLLPSQNSQNVVPSAALAGARSLVTPKNAGSVDQNTHRGVYNIF